MTGKDCVHCAVRADPLLKTQVNLRPVGRDMTQSGSYLPGNHRRVLGSMRGLSLRDGQSVTCRGFSPRTSGFPRQCHFTNAQR